MKTEKYVCTETEENTSLLKKISNYSVSNSIKKSNLPFKETCLNVSISVASMTVENNKGLKGDTCDSGTKKLQNDCSEYDDSQSKFISALKSTKKSNCNVENCIEVLEPLLTEKEQLNTNNDEDKKTKVLKEATINDSNKKEENDEYLVASSTSNENHQLELSWKRVLEEHKVKRAKEAVIVLGQQQTFERSSPFGYKSWLLRLSHKKRFEILIAIGIFLWLAFFIVLAIFMNGPSSKQENSDDSVVTDRTTSDEFSMLHKPAVSVNKSRKQENKNNSLEASSSTYVQLNTNTTTISSTAKDDATESNKKYKTTTRASAMSFPVGRNRTEVSATSPLLDSKSKLLNDSSTTSEETVYLQHSSAASVATFVPELLDPVTAISSTTADNTIESGRKYKLYTEASTTTAGVTAANSSIILNSIEDSLTKEKIENFQLSSAPSVASFAPKVLDPVTENSLLSRSSTFLGTQGRLTSTFGRTESEKSFNQLLSSLPGSELPVNLNQLLKGKEPEYEVGVGRADITGPPADVNMMGYANPSQTSGGIHMRQYSRAFIVSRQKSRVVFVSIDACMGSTLVKLEVLKVLKSHYGDMYTADNLCISGTHTHSAPAGFLQDILFQITSMGYVPETLRAMVDGIVESIHIAHRRMTRGYILINKGELLGSNINRSPMAYLNNPPDERKRYKYNVDKEMFLLKFLDEKGNGIGAINWFPVHCTSMNNTNSLISGDNKGYAELLFEQEMDPGSLAGESDFVGAFAQSNEGDVSPNINGPHCIDTGLPCDNFHSTCNGKVQNCIASGPGKDMFESTKIIAQRQFEKALKLYNEASTFLSGPLQAVHQYIDMTNQTVMINNTSAVHTCKPAMGFSFAAGTTDGPGAFDFKQGDKSGNTFWRLVRNFLHSPSKVQTDCHYPKPILIDTGEMQYPYSWQPNIVDTQLFRVGQLLISAVPGEFTTMSGRRLKEAVFQEFSKAFPFEKFESVIAGLSNTYSDYITTFEEYHVQRYEGASTIFGPHTLAAYMQQYKKLASSLIYEVALSGGSEARDLLPELMSFVPGVVMDNAPFGYDFGDLLIDANDTYHAGDVVSVQFVAGNPRNSPAANMTFLSVERKTDKDTWEVFKTDADWDTKYIWERTLSLGKLRGLSEVMVKFDTSSVTSSGRFRINHYGHYKYFWNGKIYAYNGRSKEFSVIKKDSNS